MTDYSGVEKVFAHAVALEQSGKMKSVIACKGRVVYMSNFDKTAILRFELSRANFEKEVCFKADDYDSDHFFEREGKIIFEIKGDGGFDRKKICRAPDTNFQELDERFSHFWDVPDERIVANINLTSKDLNLLDENLSHVEFLSEERKPTILQRDIFAGSIIKLERKKVSGLMAVGDNVKDDFGPVGMRTNDLFALFAFNPALDLFFLDSDYGYFLAEGQEYGLQAVIARCTYDDLGVIGFSGEEEQNGRQEQENGNPQQEAGGDADEGAQPQGLRRRNRQN